MFKTITECVYFSLRKQLGRESKKVAKVPAISAFFKKLNAEEKNYNKNNARKPAKRVAKTPAKKTTEITKIQEIPICESISTEEYKKAQETPKSFREQLEELANENFSEEEE